MVFRVVMGSFSTDQLSTLSMTPKTQDTELHLGYDMIS